MKKKLLLPHFYNQKYMKHWNQVIIALVAVTGFAITACKGPIGPQGGQGLPGEQGPRGEQGSQGEQGPLPDNSIIESDYLPSLSSWLPVIIINTSQEVVDKVTWIPASYSIHDSNGILIIEGTTGIRGRGNSTWGMPKKPYNLNLDTATNFLGMPSHRRWSLLANYADKTLLRTDVAFNKLAKIFDNLAWTPRSQYVDLYLNDIYRGVYQLTESIRVDANRVNFNSISSANGTGGFLLEVDERMGDEFNFRSNQGVAFNCSSPDSNLNVLIAETSTTIFEKIKNYVQEAEDALYGNDFTNPVTGWQKYLDIDTFVDWYLINEITKNNDAIFFSSVYMYYDPTKEKLCMGPLWDFDISMGNINYNGSDNINGFWIKNAKWISRLFEDPVFVAAVKTRWNAKYSQLSGIYSFIDERAASLFMAQYQNFNKWLILDKQVWPNAVVMGSYTGEIAYLKSWLRTRIAWLNTELNKL